MKITQPKKKILITLSLLLAVIILKLAGAECFFLSLTGIPCPGCGMTRAVISAVSADFVSAFSHHAMFWSLPVLYLYFLTDGRLFKNKALNTLVFILIAVGFGIVWVTKIVSLL